MYGVSLDGPQPVIVMEYCEGGIIYFNQLLFLLVISHDF
jgi:hypothetical protein